MSYWTDGGWLSLFNGSGDDDGGGGGPSFFDQFYRDLLSGGQEQDIVKFLMGFNDSPTSPLGQASRSTLQERLDPNWIPQFFRPDVLNPFVNAQFRLGREQLGRDQTSQQDLFQRMGAFFTPDLPQAQSRLSERQNLNEQDFLANLGFQGGTLAEQLRTNALDQAFGLEKTSASILDQLLGRQNERFSMGANLFSNLDRNNTARLSGIDGGGGGLGFGTGFGLDQLGALFDQFSGNTTRGANPSDLEDFVSGRQSAQGLQSQFLPGSGGTDFSGMLKDPNTWVTLAKLFAAFGGGGG